MTAIRTTAPTVLAVSLDDAKLAMRIDGSDLDALVTNWIKGVIADLEHETGLCLMSQGWTTTLDAFPTCAISLPHPVISITSVQYLDANGATQTLSSGAYRINRARYETTITPVTGTDWPATQDETGAVTIVTVNGVGTTDAATPANVKLYVLAKLVEQFDPATRLENRDTPQSKYLDRLLDACRSY